MAGFVVSYSHNDGQEKVKRFLSDLSEKLQIQHAIPLTSGYLDVNDIPPGGSWSQELADALRTSRAILPMYSLNYFGSEHCGREMQVFRMRQGAGSQRAILPVLWVAPQAFALPPSVADLHYKLRPATPDSYYRHGLERLMSTSDYQGDYIQTVYSIASELAEMFRTELPPLPALTYADIPSAFKVHRDGTPAPPAASVASGRRLRRVQFICVSGPQSFYDFRNCRDAYGDEEWAWQPFIPPGGYLGDLLTQVASKEGFLPEFGCCDANLVSTIHAAAAARKIVVLIVDSWALKKPPFPDILSHFDTQNFMNCAVIIPWNEADAETREARDSLLRLLQETLPFRWNNYQENSPLFRRAITSQEQFMRDLSQVLSSIRSLLRDTAIPASPAPASTLPTL